MIIEFNWLSQPGVSGVINMLYTIIDIIRIVVPIVLIVMTTIDITKKIIDPSEKEGQKKIMIRAIAAVIVFLIPTIVNITLRLLGIDTNIDIDRSTSSVTPTAVPIVTPMVTETPIPTQVPTFTPTPTSSLLNQLNITNCPDKSINFKVGDKITLNTDIPSSFDGTISWKADDASAVRVTYNNNKTEATFDIIDQPRLGTVWVTIVAGGQVGSCYFHIIAVDNLEITNCPSENQIYHVGDRFLLQSNLPSYYKGTFNWGSSTSPNTFKFTPSADGRECYVEILEVPERNYAYIGFGADSKSTTCMINIQ